MTLVKLVNAVGGLSVWGGDGEVIPERDLAAVGRTFCVDNETYHDEVSRRARASGANAYYVGPPHPVEDKKGERIFPVMTYIISEKYLPRRKSSAA